MAEAPVINVPALNADEITLGMLVLSVWRKRLYPAKIIEISGQKPHRQFKVTYVGFGKRFDHKVKEAHLPNRIGKYIPAQAPEPVKQLIAAADNPDVGSPPAKKAKVDPPAVPEQFESDSSEHGDDEEEAVELSHELAEILIKDRELVNTHGMIAKLPARINVKLILERYALSLDAADFEVIHPDSERPITKQELLVHAAELCEFFDDVLANRLLYKSEVALYEDFLEDHQNMSPSEICGLPHLIRLAVFHDEFMQETDWDQPTIEYVRKKVQYLVDYLGSEISLDMHFNVDIDYVLAEGVGGAEVAEENEEPDEEVADENEAFHAEVAEEDEALHAEVAEEDEELHEQVTDEDETLHAEIADENEAPEANAL